MSKMSTDLIRHRLTGATMGTFWTADLYAPPACDPVLLQRELQAAVDEIDSQMSTWTPASDLMRLNAAPCDTWLPVPAALFEVLQAGLQIGRLSGGAFEMNLGDVIRAWGFGPDPISLQAIMVASAVPARPASDLLQLDPDRRAVRKHGPVALDLSGIAKGYGVDRLTEVMARHDIARALCSIDGEVRALDAPPDGRPWSVVVERPDAEDRALHSVLALRHAAVATSGDYRHFVELRGQRLAHTADPRRRAPLLAAPASVTVMAPTCMAADALATALMVMGPEAGLAFAAPLGVSALYLVRTQDGLRSHASGVFADMPPGQGPIAAVSAGR